MMSNKRISKSNLESKQDVRIESPMRISKSQFVTHRRDVLITDEYTFGKELGSGSFGTVRKATHKKTNFPRAIKILKLEGQDKKKLISEVEILSKLSHPNIMQVYEFYEDMKNFYIVSEYCEGGELFDIISSKGVFSEYEASIIVKQILSAIAYSHQNNIVHTDLKPENILLDDRKEGSLLKIIDWGGAKYFQKNKKLNKISGTPYYIAPEVLEERYDEKCDIWSVGVILYILLCGYPPFNGDSDIEIMKSVKKGKFDFPKEEWELVSKEAKHLVTYMLKYDAKARYSAVECMNHAWFKNQNKDKKDNLMNSNLINNMKKFRSDRKLEQATISFIVSQMMSREERNELLLQFQTWDKNGDGVLSKEEIYQGYKQSMGEYKALEEVDKIMESCDLDGNGYIDYNEFLAATLNRTKLLTQKNLEITFNAFDKDHSGKINANELLSIFNLTGNKSDMERITKIIQEADENGDGEISLSEFKNLMMKIY